jgi:hypothetical protein
MAIAVSQRRCCFIRLRRDPTPPLGEAAGWFELGAVCMRLWGAKEGARGCSAGKLHERGSAGWNGKLYERGSAGLNGKLYERRSAGLNGSARLRPARSHDLQERLHDPLVAGL